MRLYSTADDRGFARNRFIGCLSETCRRDARDPLVSPAIQDRRRFRIANILPAFQDRRQPSRMPAKEILYVII
ncbi:MAG: hypothetical protein LBP59_17315 [Planctomycetaceae bacterium]|nr:hypothetical protein [Planctomycetaceae bacterium]